MPESIAPACPEPPRNRGIWVRANIISRDEFSSAVDGYEGYAMWNEATKDWLDLRGMSIRRDFHAEFRILSWIELSERARGCPEHETTTDANVYYWDDEFRRADGSDGFYALCDIRHSLTGVRFANLRKGPFATREDALTELIVMLVEPVLTNPDANQP